MGNQVFGMFPQGILVQRKVIVKTLVFSFLGFFALVYQAKIILLLLLRD